MPSSRLIPLSLLLVSLPALAQPAPYRALGTEPFWSLTIAGDRLIYTPANGRAVTVARPPAIPGINGELYRTPRITVDITHVRCSDGMSDRRYADTVRVAIDGRSLRGCGGAVSQPSVLADTQWRISAIDGRPLRFDRPATIAFGADSVSGRICNSYRGSYRVAHGTLATGAIMATKMACPGGLSAAESAILRTLGKPLKVHRGSDDTLVLGDGRSSLTLRRVR